MACSLCNTQMDMELIYMPCCKAVYHSFCANVLLDWTAGNKCNTCHAQFSQDLVDNLRIRTLYTMDCGICNQRVTCRPKLNRCDHWFHSECLARYTENITSCPVCSFPIPEDAPEQYALIRKDEEARAAWDFLTMSVEPERLILIDSLVPDLFKYILRSLVAEHPNKPQPHQDADHERESKKARDSYWTPERILFTVYRKNAQNMSAARTSDFKSALTHMHQCGPQCPTNPCLVRQWQMEEAEALRQKMTQQNSSSSPDDALAMSALIQKDGEEARAAWDVITLD